MRRSSYIVFSAEYEDALEMFRAIGQESQLKASGGFRTISLYMDSREYRELVAELDRRGIQYSENFRQVFSEEELESAEYLVLESAYHWGYPQGNYRQLCFDLSVACPLCGNGASQKAPFRVKPPLPKRREWVLLHWVYEHLVTERIANLMLEAGLTGFTFWPILHKTGQEIPGWKQLHIEHELPSMSARTTFPIVSGESDPEIEKQFGVRNPPLCPCGKLGRNFPETYYYDRTNLDHFQDFNKAFEWLGGGATTYQAIIFSQRAFRLLRQERIHPLHLKPVVWV